MLKAFRKKKFKLQLAKHIDDLLISLGCGLIVYTTSLLSVIAAMYVSGVLLIVFGILIGLGMDGEK